MSVMEEPAQSPTPAAPKAEPLISVVARDPAMLLITTNHMDGFDRIRELPQREYKSRFRHWEVPAIDDNIKKLMELFTREEMTLDAESEVILRYVRLRSAVAAKKENRRWEYIFDGKVPEIAYTPTTKPFNHQLVALDALHNAEFFGLFMEMGTGKTKVILDEIAWCVRDRKHDARSKNVKYIPLKVLIVAPNNVCQNWIKEMGKHWPKDLTFDAKVLALLPWANDQMIEQVRAVADVKVLICSFDRVSILQEFLMMFKFDLMVVDESARIKSPWTKRTKACQAVAESCTRRIAMTGSPVINNVLDVYSQFEFLSPGLLGFSSFNAFKARYAVLERDAIRGFKNLDELKARMARYSFVVKKADCLDLPPKTYETVTIDMSPKQKELYEQMLSWLIASIDGDIDNAKTTTKAAAIIAQLTRLRQIADGFIANGENDWVPIEGANGKKQQLLDDLEDIGGKLIVWRSFRYDTLPIREAFKESGWKWVEITGDTPQSVRHLHAKAFNEDDSIRGVIADPVCAGEGIDLLGSKTMRCADVVYWTNSFALGPRLQSEDRCHRIGQDSPVTYRDYVMADTIEEQIAQALQNKKDLAKHMTDVHGIKDMLMSKNIFGFKI